jgi:hypothetical protein
MTLADLALAAFAVCNSARVLAYVPQIIRAARDCHGASAISLTTWSLFAASNVSTSVYAVVQLDDWAVAGVFALNTLSCLAIVGITAWKRLGRKSAPPRESMDAPEPTPWPVLPTNDLVRPAPRLRHRLS